MKQIGTAFLLLLATGSGVAQSSNWRQVEEVAEGSNISVQSAHRLRAHCQFVAADDASLTCERIYRLIGRSKRYRFDRTAVRQVRLEHREGNRALTVVVVVGGFAALGGVPGMVIGLSFGIATYVAGGALRLIPSTLVYRRPADPGAPSTTAVAPVSAVQSSSDSAAPMPQSTQPE